jgi:hypothetical protein
MLHPTRQISSALDASYLKRRYYYNNHNLPAYSTNSFGIGRLRTLGLCILKLTILFFFPSAHCSHDAAEPLADEATNAVTREGSPYL